MTYVRYGMTPLGLGRYGLGRYGLGDLPAGVRPIGEYGEFVRTTLVNYILPASPPPVGTASFLWNSSEGTLQFFDREERELGDRQMLFERPTEAADVTAAARRAAASVAEAARRAAASGGSKTGTATVTASGKTVVLREDGMTVDEEATAAARVPDWVLPVSIASGVVVLGGLAWWLSTRKRKVAVNRRGNRRRRGSRRTSQRSRRLTSTRRNCGVRT